MYSFSSGLIKVLIVNDLFWVIFEIYFFGFLISVFVFVFILDLVFYTYLCYLLINRLDVRGMERGLGK